MYRLISLIIVPLKKKNKIFINFHSYTAKVCKDGYEML